MKELWVPLETNFEFDLPITPTSLSDKNENSIKPVQYYSVLEVIFLELFCL